MTIRLTRVVAPLAAATLVAGTAAHLGFDDGASARASTVTREALIQRIASDYAPTLLLDSSEELRPVALDRYVGKTDLYLLSYWRCFKTAGRQNCRSRIDPKLEPLPTSKPTCAPGRSCHYYLSPGGEKIERFKSYLRLQGELLADARPTVYWNLDESSATVQYWFFYVFNRFANRHEGDWEQITIEFNRTADFLARPTPFRVGYSSHEVESAACGGTSFQGRAATPRARSCSSPADRMRTTSIRSRTRYANARDYSAGTAATTTVMVWGSACGRTATTFDR